MDRKQRRKLRQALLMELELLKIKENGATKEEIKGIDARKKAIGMELGNLLNERVKLNLPNEKDDDEEENIEKKETAWDRQKELCEKNGITEKYFMSRVYQGMNEVLAATKPMRTGPIFTKEERRIMEENGISYSTAKERVSKHRWKVEEAITCKPGEKPKNKNYKMGIHDKRG